MFFSDLYTWWYGLETEVKPTLPGPGRNFRCEALVEAKLKLRSPEIVESLRNASQVSEALLARRRLRHVVVTPRPTTFPTRNPVLRELLNKVPKT